jgi:F-type H+-transporting ATPase subunit b
MDPFNFVPGTLLASGAVNVDLDPTFIVQFLLFGFFILVMKDVLFDPLLLVFEEREKRTAGAIAEAREMDERALALKQEYEGRLEGIRREAAVDRERVRAQVKKLETELTEAARAKVGARLQEGLGEVQREVQRIRRDLEAQRGTLATEIATRVLGRAVGTRDEARP